MDFEFPESQKTARLRAEEFAREQIRPGAAGRDAESAGQAGPFQALLQTYADSPFPDEHGGKGKSAQEFWQEVCGLTTGSMDVGMVRAYLMHVMAGIGLWKLGNDAQREKYLRSIAAGTKVATYAPGDWEAGLAGPACPLQARNTSKGWVLDGKVLAHNAENASLILVHAAVDGSTTVRTFIVDLESDTRPGMTPVARGSLRSAPVSEIAFHQYAVHESQCLPSLDVEIVRNWLRLSVTASLAGSAAALTDLGLATLKGGTRAGRPLKSLQPWRLNYANCRITVRLFENLLHRAAWSLDQTGHDPSEAVLVAQLFVCERIVGLANDVSRLCGESASDPDRRIERLARDALDAETFAGGLELNRTLLGAFFLKAPDKQRNPS